MLIERPRRLRRTPAIRELVRETRLHPSELICPLFVVEGSGIREEIPMMPEQYHLSADFLAREAAQLYDLGVGGLLLFGIPDHKDAVGSGAYDENGIIQRAVREIKSACPDMLVITDVCLCEYTDHGHCGLLTSSGEVDNDSTLPLIARTALSHAQSGADMVAPSDMMDGRVASIRDALDSAGFTSTPIMAYSAKYASAYYGPFRTAAGSAPRRGDRKGYQMDPANGREALRECELDLREGADILMVKPALAYLDVIERVRREYNVPLAAYSVSGEYSMLTHAVKNGILAESAIEETTLAIKRAGADIIITYFAKMLAQKLKTEGNA